MTDEENGRGAGNLAAQLASELDCLMQGIPVGARFSAPPSADVCTSLELLLPRILRKCYPEWEKESLDGIFVARATKTGPGAAELIGTCILISDQTVTPFVVHLELSPPTHSDALSAVRISLGEPGGGALGISGPPCNSRDAQRLLASVVGRIKGVAWSYVCAWPLDP